MKWLAIILLSASGLCAEITDDELRQISKEDIVLTIRHLRSLTAEAVASADRGLPEIRVAAAEAGLERSK